AAVDRALLAAGAGAGIGVDRERDGVEGQVDGDVAVADVHGAGRWTAGAGVSGVTGDDAAVDVRGRVRNCVELECATGGIRSGALPGLLRGSRRAPRAGDRRRRLQRG